MILRALTVELQSLDTFLPVVHQRLGTYRGNAVVWGPITFLEEPDGWYSSFTAEWLKGERFEAIPLVGPLKNIKAVRREIVRMLSNHQ